MTESRISRRTMLAGTAALPLAAGLSATPSFAGSHGGGPQNAIQNTFALGDFQVSTLLAGTRAVEDVQTIFGLNVTPEEFAAVSARNFIPADKAQFFFNPTVVRTGSEVVLFDTGLSAAGTTAALEAAGIMPGDVTIVVITHMHGDHIGGLTDDAGNLTYPNARYVGGQVDYDYWTAEANETVAAKVTPFAEQFEFVGDGHSVVPGITGMAAFGHTPGHMVYMLDSGGKQVLLMADTANHYVWSLAYPDWEVRFDIQKAEAAATRKQVLGMAAADRIPLIGYHMPFPGIGFVEARGEGGFHYVPASYQMML